MGKQLPGYVEHHNSCTKELEQGNLVSDTGRIEKYNNGEDRYNIYSFEQLDMKLLRKFDVPSMVESPTNIIIIRDILNWAASLTFKVKDYNVLWDPYVDREGRISSSMINIYKDLLIEAIDRTLYPTVIGYNKWTTDENYRSNLAGELGMTFTDDGFEEMPSFGDGSSFSYFQYVNKASSMDTLNRWKYLPEGVITRILSDAHLLELTRSCRDLIGPIPWMEQGVLT
jgi:hypothetical protein